VPMLEAASLEEEADMVEMWANLLTSAAKGGPVLPSYVALLAELSR